jgi:hypothetical protein
MGELHRSFFDVGATYQYARLGQAAVGWCDLLEREGGFAVQGL